MKKPIKMGKFKQNEELGMLQTLRHPEILEIARSAGKVTVEKLSQRFGVAVQTIRRDLSDLAASGHLERVHGGAVYPSGTVNLGYDERRILNTHAKRAIAKVCADEIPDNVSIFLNIGTSTEAVAEELLQHKNLMVATNNMNVANILARNKNCKILVTGGQLRRADGGLVGNLAADIIRQFKFDIAVIGCSALDNEGDILDYDIQEVAVSRTILRQSRKTFLVSDHTKFTRSAPVRIASVKDIDTIFIDQPPSSELTSAYARWNTQITIAC